MSAETPVVRSVRRSDRVSKPSPTRPGMVDFADPAEVTGLGVGFGSRPVPNPVTSVEQQPDSQHMAADLDSQQVAADLDSQPASQQVDPEVDTLFNALQGRVKKNTASLLERNKKLQIRIGVLQVGSLHLACHPRILLPLLTGTVVQDELVKEREIRARLEDGAHILTGQLVSASQQSLPAACFNLAST